MSSSPPTNSNPWSKGHKDGPNYSLKFNTSIFFPFRIQDATFQLTQWNGALSLLKAYLTVFTNISALILCTLLWPVVIIFIVSLLSYFLCLCIIGFCAKNFRITTITASVLSHGGRRRFSLTRGRKYQRFCTIPQECQRWDWKAPSSPPYNYTYSFQLWSGI